MPDTMWFGYLPDGMHDVVVAPNGGVYISGFDSRNRVCLVLFAPRYGQQLLTVAQLPYRDYGRYTPTVLLALDPLREGKLYILLYLHPDNLGSQEMSLFRLDSNSGERVLLNSITSPFWLPTAMLPCADGSVLLSLSGLGPILLYPHCNESACEAPTRRSGNASEAIGKVGLAQVNGQLCMIVNDLSPLHSADSSPTLVCEDSNGSILPVLLPSKLLGSASRAADGEVPLSGPSRLGQASDGSLYIITRNAFSEYGFAQGSVHLLRPRSVACPPLAPPPSSPPLPSGHGSSTSLSTAWEEPQLLVRSVSNPRSVAIDFNDGILYVLEQNTLEGFSYQSFHGDVLAFCLSGRYDCGVAQNSGECECAVGWGGSCCDLELVGWLGHVYAALLAYSPLVIALLAVAMLILIPRRRGSHSGRQEEMKRPTQRISTRRGSGKSTSGRGASSDGEGEDPSEQLRAPLCPPADVCGRSYSLPPERMPTLNREGSMSLRSVLMGTDALPSPTIVRRSNTDHPRVRSKKEREEDASAPDALSDLYNFSVLVECENSEQSEMRAPLLTMEEESEKRNANDGGQEVHEISGQPPRAARIEDNQSCSRTVE